MVSTSELLAVKGMTKELYLALRDYVSALPKMTPINVNTAPEPVFRFRSPNSRSQGLSQFLESRREARRRRAATVRFERVWTRCRQEFTLGYHRIFPAALGDH